MTPSIKNGRLLVIITIALVVFTELIAWIFLWRNARWTSSDLFRTFITLWLFWNLWDGSRWARWILVLCLLGATGYVVYFLVFEPVLGRRPDAAVIFGALGLMTFILALFLISPWVSAFLKHQREKENTPPVPAPE